MSNKDLETDDDSNPIGKDWKEYWQSKEKDPSRKRETRQEKKAARRQIHKKNRKNTKERLKNWQDDVES